MDLYVGQYEDEWWVVGICLVQKPNVNTVNSCGVKLVAKNIGLTKIVSVASNSI